MQVSRMTYQTVTSHKILPFLIAHSFCGPSLKESKVDIERHTKGPKDVDSKKPIVLQHQPYYSIGMEMVSHLNCPGLELAERGVLAGYLSIFGDQAGNIHAQITPRGEEDEAVDRFIEAASQQKGGEDEEDAEQ